MQRYIPAIAGLLAMAIIALSVLVFGHKALYPTAFAVVAAASITVLILNTKTK